jgi:hypothetical protein
MRRWPQKTLAFIAFTGYVYLASEEGQEESRKLETIEREKK